MNVRQYMERRCICGALRREHVHFREVMPSKDGGEGVATGRFQVLPVADHDDCRGFVDEIELSLSGNPATNALLAEIAGDRTGWTAEELVAGQRNPPKEKP